MTMLANDLLRGAKAAAVFTGLPVRTIYHLADTGELPVIRKRGGLYFKRSELEQAFSSAASLAESAR